MQFKGQVIAPKQACIIQPKLEINTPGDKYEQEADAMADRVMRIVDNNAPKHQVSSLVGPSVQRKCAECEEEEKKEKPLMRKAESGGYGMQAPSSLVSSLNSSKGGGSPLPQGTRNFMESAFSADFSRVRVHNDSQASEMSGGINAKAFTHGSDIYFSGGQYAPEKAEGKRLLTHELTHVVQQEGLIEPGIKRKTDTDSPKQRQVSPDNPDLIAGHPVRRPDDEPIREIVDYAFFYAGGGYGDSAKKFFETFYPDYIKVTGASFEDMFDKLYQDMISFKRRKKNVRVGDIVIVTHANAAGGLKIPLTRDDIPNHKFFAPWNLTNLQKEFQDKTNSAYAKRQHFRTERHDVVSNFLSSNSRVIIRGCEFGQSQDGLDALKSFFGGKVFAWAPKGYQGYEVAKIGRSHLKSGAEAFDMLKQQGLIPEDLEPTKKEKEDYIHKLTGGTGLVPSQFFIVGEEDHKKLADLIQSKQGLSAAAEPLHQLKEVDQPGSEEKWGSSTPSALGRDPEIDRLSIDEIVRRAGILTSNYKEEYAPMLRRLSDAWDRHPDKSRYLDAHATAESKFDPLYGSSLTGGFGDSNLTAIDAGKFKEESHYDQFEDEALPYEVPQDVSKAVKFENEVGAVDPAAGSSTAQTTDPSVNPTVDDQSGKQKSAKEKKYATRQQVHDAADFSKKTTTPAPVCEPEIGWEKLVQLAGTDDGLKKLLTTPPDNTWSLGDTLDVASLAIGVATAPSTVLDLEVLFGISAFAWDLIGLAGPVLDIIDLFVSIETAAGLQKEGAKVTGVSIGLDYMPIDIDGNFNVDDWISWAKIGSIKYEREIEFGYPLSAEESVSNMRQGMVLVSESSRAGVNAALEIIAMHLRHSCADDKKVNEKITEIRHRVSEIVLLKFYVYSHQLVDYWVEQRHKKH